MNHISFIVEERWSSHPCNVHHARATVRNFMEMYGIDSAELVELAIGEACANAVEHGSPYGSDSCFTIRCGLASEKREAIFEVEDEGLEFGLTRLTMVHPPDLESEGGRGLFLMNQIMDDVAVLSSPRGLIVRMVKRLPA